MRERVSVRWGLCSGRVVAILFCLFIAPVCQAQIELYAAIDVSYPQLINTSNHQANYGQISFGPRIGIAYKPEDVQFFPILTAGFGRTRLPLLDYEKNDVAALTFNYINVMLNENYVINFSQSQLLIYGGIGFSDFNRKGLALAGDRAGTMEASIDSVKYPSKIFPAMNLGFEYIYGDVAGKDMYLGIGVNFQYILLLQERNTYYISVNDPQNGINHYSAALTGNAISPGFYIAFHYILHKK